ncbi:erythroblast NAD(P)(+)--arginine ADP-ribosyltransferase-like protein [Turdus rufiventris]|nr:erythroblast NAD(P)(+)--arginine ADP-ribosyltransferase-like protein [Turdus rufiventris]
MALLPPPPPPCSCYCCRNWEKPAPLSTRTVQKKCPHWSLWRLPSMALLPLTLALLAVTVATTAIEEKPLDMAMDSFDDPYRGCRCAMKAELPALIHSEFQKNSRYAELWPKAIDMWQHQGSPVYPLLSQDHAIAIMAFTMLYQGDQFNEEVRVAGHSPQEYRDNFHFKALHFLLTDALAMLRDAQKEQKCRCVFRRVDKYKFKANVGDVIRFGQFALSSLCENTTKGFGSTTLFKVQTCHGVYIKEFAEYHEENEVLIPPFEKFKVTKVIEKGDKVEIHLNSFGTYSTYNCEWLTGYLQGPLPPRRTPPGHHSPDSGHRDPLNHVATKVTEVSMVTVATMATMAT